MLVRLSQMFEPLPVKQSQEKWKNACERPQTHVKQSQLRLDTGVSPFPIEVGVIYLADEHCR